MSDEKFSAIPDDAYDQLIAQVRLLNCRIDSRVGHSRMSLAVSIWDILGPIAGNDQGKQQED